MVSHLFSPFTWIPAASAGAFQSHVVVAPTSSACQILRSRTADFAAEAENIARDSFVAHAIEGNARRYVTSKAERVACGVDDIPCLLIFGYHWNDNDKQSADGHRED